MQARQWFGAASAPSGRDPACSGNPQERPYLLERLPARVRIPLSDGEHAVGTQKRAMLGCSCLVTEIAEPKGPQPLSAMTILLFADGLATESIQVSPRTAERALPWRLQSQVTLT